jgi:hypothetical protein
LQLIAGFPPSPSAPPADDSEPTIVRAKIDLLASFGYLMRVLRGDGRTDLVLDDRVPVEVAVNTVASALPIDVATRHQLLEESSLELRLQHAARLIHALLESALRTQPPELPRN